MRDKILFKRMPPKDKVEMDDSQKSALPKHIGIILDGNGRWAKQRSLPRLAGHAAGVKPALRIIDECLNLGIEALTLFTFSMENWQRSEQETSHIINIAYKTGKSTIDDLHNKNVKILFIGNMAKLNASLQEKIKTWEKLTEKNTGLKLIIAASYSGRWDITQAVKKIITQIKNKQLSENTITEETIRANLCGYNLPEPDLIIRTGGEIRISNFLLWQIAYAELYFTELFWPDFSVEEFKKALDNFAKRNRRFGRVD